MKTIFREYSSAGRAFLSQKKGHKFNSCYSHHILKANIAQLVEQLFCKQ